MRCTRAAVVEYRTVPNTLDLAGSDISQQVDARIGLEARVVRRLLSRSDAATPWVSEFLDSIAASAIVPIASVSETLRSDPSTFNDLQSSIREYEEVARRWQLVVTHLCGAVPHKTLAKLVESHQSEADRKVLRFGQQVETLLSLPTDAGSLSRCLSVIDRLGAWVDAAAMSDTAEVVFRLTDRIEETRRILLENLRQQYAEALERTLSDFLKQAAIGYGIPERRIAFRGDTVFVFDGQYSVEEMRMLAAEYMADIEARMNAVAEENDRLRAAAAAENPNTISEHVRAVVWRRDQGRCVVCGGVSDLEFDHIIPKSHGGASSVSNLQVLCTRCNERKGAHVARIRVPRNGKGSDETLDLFRANSIPLFEHEQM